MSHYPPPGPPYGHWPPPPPPHHPPPPPHHHPPPPHHYPPPPHPEHHHYPPPPGYPGPHPGYYVTGAVMLPLPVPSEPPNSTYITNYIYHGETSSSSTPTNHVPAIESSGDYDWVPSTATTANRLQGRALIGGHEGWDGSPLWVIRAWHNGNLIPGKLAVRHSAAYIMYDGKEIPVQNIEVLCSRPETLRWVPASNGSVPAGAVAGGRTAGGETLYVGRARHQLSITPGKVHPSHNTCYISFGGSEVSHKMYDVLCTV